MSDENTPKLRLRPKLAGGPPPITPLPANPASPAVVRPPGAAVPVPEEVSPEPKPAGLRPKISLKHEVPAQSDEAANLAKPAPLLEPAPSLDPRTFAPPSTKPLLISRKPALIPPAEGKSPVDSGATPPFAVDGSGEKKFPAVLNAPPPPRIKVAIPLAETWPAVLNAPPPPGLSPVPASLTGTEEEPAEIAAIRKASTFPFPSPTAKFPPLPGLGATGGTEPTETAAPEGFLKKLLLIGAVVLLLLGGGAAFAYFKFFAKPKASTKPEVSPAAVVAQPRPAPAQGASKTKQMIDKVQQEQLAPLNEVLGAEPAPAPAKSAIESTPLSVAPVQTAETSITPATPSPAPVKAPPPPPSLAFKAWVINLKIRGVRGGDAQRVFIEKISYVPGDVVNQQLGIIFTGYDETTRMLTFQDKTGATFERRH